MVWCSVHVTVYARVKGQESEIHAKMAGGSSGTLQTVFLLRPGPEEEYASAKETAASAVGGQQLQEV